MHCSAITPRYADSRKETGVHASLVVEAFPDRSSIHSFGGAWGCARPSRKEMLAAAYRVLMCNFTAALCGKRNKQLDPAGHMSGTSVTDLPARKHGRTAGGDKLTTSDQPNILMLKQREAEESCECFAKHTIQS